MRPVTQALGAIDDMVYRNSVETTCASFTFVVRVAGITFRGILVFHIDMIIMKDSCLGHAHSSNGAI